MSPSSRRSPSGPGCRHHRHVGWCRALCAVRSLAPKAVSRPAPARPRPTGPARCPAGDGGAWCVVARPRWRKTSKDGIRCEEDSGGADTATASRTCRAGRATRTRGSRLGSAAVPAGRVDVSPSTRPHPYRCSGRSGPVGPGTDAGRLRPGAVGSNGDHGRCHHVDDLLDSLAARSGADSALTTSRVSSDTAQPANPPGAR